MTEQVTTRIDIDVRSESADRAAALLDKLVAAEGRAIDSSEQLASASDKTNKTRERSENVVDKLAKKYDLEYRAMRAVLDDLERLDRAYKAGLGGTEAYERGLSGVRQKFEELTNAAKGATSALDGMSDKYLRITPLANRYEESVREINQLFRENKMTAKDASVAMDRLAASYEKTRAAAIKEIQSPLNALLGVKDYDPAETKRREADIAAFGAELDKVEARTNKLAAAERAHTAVVVEMQSWVSKGAASHKQVANAIAEETAAYHKLRDSILATSKAPMTARLDNWSAKSNSFSGRLDMWSGAQRQKAEDFRPDPMVAKLSSWQKEVTSFTGTLDAWSAHQRGIAKTAEEAAARVDPMINKLSAWSSEVTSFSGKLDAWSAHQRSIAQAAEDAASRIDPMISKMTAWNAAVTSFSGRLDAWAAAQRGAAKAAEEAVARIDPMIKTLDSWSDKRGSFSGRLDEWSGGQRQREQDAAEAQRLRDEEAAKLDAQGKSAKRLREQELDIAAARVAENDRIHASLSPLFDAELKYRNALSAANAEARNGVISETERAAAINRATDALTKQVQALQKAGDIAGDGGTLRSRQIIAEATALRSQGMVNEFAGVRSVGDRESRQSDIEAAFKGIDELRAELVPAARAELEFAAAVEKANRSLRIGAIDEKELGAEIVRAETRRAHQLKAIERESQPGSSLDRWQKINLARQFQDVGVSIAGGQNIGLVALQQGSQIYDALASGRSSVAAGAKEMGASILRFALHPVTLLTAGLTGLGYAAYRYADQQETLNRSLNGFGRLSGATAGQLRSMSDTAARSGSMSQGEAVSAAAQYASAGIGVENISTLLADTRRFSHAFGVDMDAAQKEIAQIVGESGLGSFEKRFGSVSFATKEMVRSLEATGRYSEAAALKTRLLDEETRKAKDSASELQKIWEKIVSWATTPVLGVGQTIERMRNGPSIDEQLRQARGDYFYLRAQRRGDQSPHPGEVEAERRMKELDAKRQEELNRPAQERRNLELNRLSQSAGSTIDSLFPDATQLRGLKESRDALQKLLGSDDGLAKLGDRADDARSALSNLNDQIGAWKSTTDQLRFSTQLAIQEISARTYAEREAVAMERARVQALQEGKGAVYAAMAADAERAKMMAESARKVDDLVRSSNDNLALSYASNPLQRRLMEIEFNKRDFTRENIPNAATPMATQFNTAGSAATRLADAMTAAAGRIEAAAGNAAPMAASSNSNVVPLFARNGGDFYKSIMRAEGTDKFGDPYNTSLGYMKSPKPLVDMTMAESLSWGDQVRRAQGLNSSAKGAFQITNTTQRDAMRALGLGANDMFNAENQNRMADWIFKTQGIGAWEGFKRPGAALPAANDNLAKNTERGFGDQVVQANYEARIKTQEEFAREIILGNDALQDRISTLGMDQRAIDESTKRQELINEAIRQTGDILPEQKRWIETNAAAWADYQEKLRAADKAEREYKENLDIARSGVSGSMSGTLKALANGESVGDALNQALTSTRDKMFDTVSSRFSEALLGPMGSSSGGLLGNIFGFGGSQNVGQANITAGVVNLSSGIGGVAAAATGGSTGGGFLSGIFDGIGSFFNSIGQNAEGTDNWRGGLTWVGEKGPELLNLPSGSQIMSNRDSVDLARSQASAANSHAAAMAMMATQRSAPAATAVASPVTVNLVGAPEGTKVQESTDAKGGRRIDVVINERVANGLASAQGQDALATMGVRRKLARY